MIKIGFGRIKKDLGLSFNGAQGIYGILKNSFVVMNVENAFRTIYFAFPVELDDEDREKIESYVGKEYAKSAEFAKTKQFYDVKLIFNQLLLGKSIDMYEKVIADLTDYFAQKYPDAKLRCMGTGCEEEENLSAYTINGSLTLLCPKCAKDIQSEIDEAYENEKKEPNNYLKGIIGAFLCAIPGILVAYIFMMLGKITALSGLVYFFLAMKGYTWFKGKLNKIGIIAVSIISILYAAFGTCISYVAWIVSLVYKNPECKEIPFIQVLKAVLCQFENPDLKKELMTNVRTSLFMCGVCIVGMAFWAFKATKKIKVTMVEKK